MTDPDAEIPVAIPGEVDREAYPEIATLAEALIEAIRRATRASASEDMSFLAYVAIKSILGVDGVFKIDLLTALASAIGSARSPCRPPNR